MLLSQEKYTVLVPKNVGFVIGLCQTIKVLFYIKKSNKNTLASVSVFIF
jgi:hypothetical protein